MLALTALESGSATSTQVYANPHRIYLAPAMIAAIENGPPHRSRDLIDPQPTCYVFLARPVGMQGSVCWFRVLDTAGSVARQVSSMLRHAF